MGEEQRRKERIDRGIKVRTEGVYAVSSWREAAYLVMPRAGLIVGLLVLPLVVTNPYWHRVITVVCVYSLLGISFDFLAHFVGLVSLGGALSIGVGGYISAIANTVLGFPPLVSISLGTVLGGGLCTLMLLPCLPLRGIYFAIVTLMYPLVMARLIEALNILGGTDGIPGVGGFRDPWVESYAIIVMLLVVLFGLRRLVNEDIGLILRGIKDNDQAVRASGISVTRYKALAVLIASSIGCGAGAYLVHLYMWAGISLFALDFSVMPIAATVIGGGGTLVGPLIGSLILVPVSELLRAFGTLRIAVYSLVLMAFIIGRNEGLMVYAQRKYHQVER
ncbi:MAG: branched-chain amino acid ABC transporter permease [Thermodesulfobacteriota bacterium]